jgi:hypothetical protein
MAFLIALTIEGQTLQYQKNELAFFAPNHHPRARSERHADDIFETTEILVYAKNRWFIGMVKEWASAGDDYSDPVPSTDYPTAEKSRLDPPPRTPTSSRPPGKVIPCPFMSTSESLLYTFRPVGLFRELPSADAVQWLYRWVGHVPDRAKVALSRAGVDAGSSVEIVRLGELLQRLESSEQCFEFNSRTAQRLDSKSQPLLAYRHRLQAGALLFQPDPGRMPGIDRLEAIVNAEWGTRLTAESVRRLRGRLCRLRQCVATDADQLTMNEAADAFEGKNIGATDSKREPQTTATADDGFISFKAATALTALRADEITRACDAGHVRSHGKGRGRKVHAADLARWVEERNKP